MRIVGSVPFVDGITRPVHQDPDGRQYVLGDDGEPVYGVWVLTPEVLEDAPLIVPTDGRSCPAPGLP